MTVPPCVLIVDDDEAVRLDIATIASRCGLASQAHASLESVFARHELPPVGCVVLELRLMTTDARELQERLMQEGAYLPLVLIAHRPPIVAAVDAVRAGAISVLEKPLEEEQLGITLRRAIERSAINRQAALRRNDLQHRLASLTPRESEILGLVMMGKSSREIADLIHRSMKTIEQHRTHILQKLGVRSAIELVRDITRLEHEQTPNSGSARGSITHD